MRERWQLRGLLGLCLPFAGAAYQWPPRQSDPLRDRPIARALFQDRDYVVYELVR